MKSAVHLSGADRVRDGNQPSTGSTTQAAGTTSSMEAAAPADPHPRYYGGCSERGDRATEPIEDIWLEQIRGCSCRERSACALFPDSDQIPRHSEMTRWAISRNRDPPMSLPARTQLPKMRMKHIQGGRCETTLGNNRLNRCSGRLRRCKRPATYPAVSGRYHVEHDCRRFL